VVESGTPVRPRLTQVSAEHAAAAWLASGSWTSTDPAPLVLAADATPRILDDAYAAVDIYSRRFAGQYLSVEPGGVRWIRCS
jgi:hypothetical protein